MKKLPLLFAIFVLLSVLISSFTLLTSEEPNFKISIKGVDHDLHDGLKPSEFAEMTIESKDENIKIEAFEITLARGNRAIEISQVKSNSFNLHKYTGIARSGDRIVVEVKKISNKNESLSPNNYTVIAIKVI
jgi:hypothetical protein